MDTTPVVTFGPLLIPQKVRRTCMSLLCVAGTHNLAYRATYHRELSLDFLRDSGHKCEKDMTRFPTCPRTCLAQPTFESSASTFLFKKSFLKQLRHPQLYHLQDIIVPRCHLKNLSKHPDHFLL